MGRSSVVLSERSPAKLPTYEIMMHRVKNFLLLSFKLVTAVMCAVRILARG